MVWCYLVLEGGIRMTENKRFKIVDEQFISYYGGTGHKISNEECGFWLWHNKEESQKVCDKLNSILDENEQLKQFKEKVFDLLDEKIKHYEHKPFSAPVGQPMSVNFDADVDRLARFSELQDLKKELQ